MFFFLSEDAAIQCQDAAERITEEVGVVVLEEEAEEVLVEVAALAGVALEVEEQEVNGEIFEKRIQYKNTKRE